MLRYRASSWFDMNDSQRLLLDLFLMFVAAKLFAEISQRLRQPPVIGELLAGVLLGPSLLNVVHPSEANLGLAEIGAIFLLFTIGLETKPGDVLRVGKSAVLVASLGVIVPFAVGFAYARAASQDLINSVFLATAMVATSVGITARILKDAGALSSKAARVILAAAVLDDILGMIALAVVTSLSTGKMEYIQLGIVAAEAIGFSLFMIFFGSRLVRQLHAPIASLHGPSSPFIFSVILCLGLSLASVYIGMAAIIGAFLAGLALADHSDEWGLQEKVHPVYEFVGPFFFVILGVQVDVGTLWEPGVWPMLTMVCLLAIVSKVLGCGLGAASLGFRDALRIAVGMIPRGEVGLIVAAVGLELHAVTPKVYTVVLLMSMVTTLFAPPVLRYLLKEPAPS
jgi:Na+:H+ antiporter